MTDKSQRPKGQGGALSPLDVAIDALNLAKEASSITPAKTAFGSASVLLTTIRDSMANEVDYVDLGLACAGACKALDRGMNGRRVDQLSQSVLGAITQLTMTVAEIQGNIVKRGKRNAISRRFHAKNDSEAITTWRSNLDRILRVFNTELETTHVTDTDTRHNVANSYTVVSDVHTEANNIVPDIRHDVSNTHAIFSDIHRNTLKSRVDADNQNLVTHASAPGDSPPLPRNAHETVSDIRRDIMKAGAMISEVHRDFVNTHAVVRNMLKDQEGTGGQDRFVRTQNSVVGESPPPPPRIFFGRDELIEKIVSFAECLTPIALVGAGGIGKTSTVLTVLHEDRIKRRFGDDRRFIRCDKFPTSLANFLRRLSKAIGAGIENPEDLTPLRPFLSSKDMLIVLDNAESVLDPHVTSSQEIYAVVEELSQLTNICLCITSRISTVPPDFEWLDIPTLSKEAACDTFHRIYRHGERSYLINNILEQLGFHPLSITLLATVAHHNKWDTDRLAREWDERRTDVLQTDHNKSLSATIELSLSSSMFQELGPNARDLLGVAAFFPQGIDENKIDWLFPTVAGRKNIFDKFCVLSLAYRNDGFVTMLAPIRDYLSPKDPMSTPVLCSIRERYFSRLSVDVEPDRPGFEETRWIMSEDVNVEHLLDVFTTIDATSDGVWGVCADFMKHLFWHKPRLVMLGPKMEALPDDHPSKLECLFQLSRLFQRVGNHTERKRLLNHTLKLSQERGDDNQLPRILMHLSRVHLAMRLHEEGIQQAREASEISGRLGDTVEQARCLVELAWLLHHDREPDAAEEAASRAISLLPEKGEQFQVCRCHRVLGAIHRSKGDTKKAVHHYEVALGIASSFNWLNLLFWIQHSLALLFFNEGRFDNAHAHVKHAKLHAVNGHDTYLMAHATKLQAAFWHRQHRLEEAKSEALCAIDTFEKLGAANDAEDVRMLLQRIDRDTNVDEPCGYLS